MQSGSSDAESCGPTILGAVRERLLGSYGGWSATPRRSRPHKRDGRSTVAAALIAPKLEAECLPLWGDYPDDDGGCDLRITEKMVDLEHFGGRPLAAQMAGTPHGAGILDEKKGPENFRATCKWWRIVDHVPTGLPSL